MAPELRGFPAAIPLAKRLVRASRATKEEWRATPLPLSLVLGAGDVPMFKPAWWGKSGMPSATTSAHRQ